MAPMQSELSPSPIADGDTAAVAEAPSHVNSNEMASARPSPALIARVWQLWILRVIAISGQVAAIAISSALGVALPLAPMVAVVVSLIALNATTWMRLRRRTPASYSEIAGHLAFDLAAFTLLLYFSGGAANPFSLLFVLHVVVMALLLPAWPAAAGALLAVAAYSLVARYHLPLRLADGSALPANLLAFGAWLSFVLTATIAAWFVLDIISLLRRHERALREAAQKAQNDATILRLGTLAAGAAHELTTPLTTMAVVADEIGREANSPSLRRDADALAAQIQACRQTISNLLAAADHARSEGGGRERLDALFEALAQRFRTLRPEVALKSECEGDLPAPEIYADRALLQTVLALLDNAADASPRDVEMMARWKGGTLRVSINDRGAGVAAADLGKLGRVFFTTKVPGKGTGLGLVLAANTAKQFGGTLRWAQRSGGGTEAELVLPLRALELPETA